MRVAAIFIIGVFVGPCQPTPDLVNLNETLADYDLRLQLFSQSEFGLSSWFDIASRRCARNAYPSLHVPQTCVKKCS